MTTEQEWAHARLRAKRVAILSGCGALMAAAVLGLPAVYLGSLTASGNARYPFTAGWLIVLMVPVVVAVLRLNIKQQSTTDAVVATLTRELTEAVQAADRDAVDRETQARGQRFERRLANALDMAEGEPEVIDVIERSFASIAPDAPVELLLADNSHAHLLRMARAVSATEASSGCGVDSPDHCPAARRAQVQRFTDSEELDACPKLRGRSGGAVSALCVPVSIMGRTVGVIHATSQQHTVFSHTTAQDVETLAKLAGARIGLLRVMAETAIQAATDSLTGLLNRRSFEQRFSLIRRQGNVVSVAMADLDHFKLLNDKYGHETGDRALLLFAQVITESVRAGDLVSRHGGEEFVVALPGCPTEAARGILDGLRERLDAAITVAGLPRFTVSFGLVEAAPEENLPMVLARADVALFQAKRDGRDRVVVQDTSGQTTPRPAVSPELQGLATIKALR
ncbi:diguanylate cyclase [Nakamurella sp. PAMC28650]|uniref:GGDEF domain-containing protein n=1 Tax=Nakamurella sp. PAMC28650 TaxID=2762325 RepID=UPI00164E3D66|nr:GGDEF domain-containing protein [Nakamurella sp. PAMC28650]QNK79370.1 GGDEF domain-containing protein [Nakamurella sp. PAMC28650]